MIVVIEGSDASGKATQSKLLAERLKATRFAFPNYESPSGKAILGNLKKDWGAVERVDPNVYFKQHGRLPPVVQQDAPKLNALVLQSLMTTNRLELLPAIKAAAEKGPVVFDRYWQSAMVYGTLDGLDPKWLDLVQRQAMPPADLNILIDVPVEEGFKRRPERKDRYESDRGYMEKVREGYLKLWGFGPDQTWTESIESLGRADKPCWYVVNGVGTVEEVQRRIWRWCGSV